MGILDNFGVALPLFLAQIINFLIVFYILKRLLYKPVLSMLKKREDQAKEGVRLSEEGKKTFEEAQIKEKEILKKAQLEAERIVNDAKNVSLENAKKIEDDAKLRSEKMITLAQEKIVQDTAEAEEKLTREVGKIALSILEKTLPNILDKKDQEEVLKRATSQIK
jgi:F-type H+-transporting ATPase subunit b